MQPVDDGHPPNEANPLLAEVLRIVGERIDPPRAELVAEFARSYLRRVPGDILVGLDPDATFHHVLGIFEFIERREEPIKVRAFNPTPTEHGYETKGTVVELVTDDSPFLHDSVTNELEAHGLRVELVLHPVIGTERSPDGTLRHIRNARYTTSRESVQHYELDRKLFAADLPALERALRSVLEDVRQVVRDFHPMMGRIDRMADLVRVAVGHFPDVTITEGVNFLQWLRDGNFVFLGYREYRVIDTPAGRAVEVVPDSGLGILSDERQSSMAEPVLLEDLPPDLARRYETGDLVVITKTNRYSTVHRRAKMDYVGVRMVGPEGETIGEARLLGLFTSKAYMQPASQIPILRAKLADIVAAEDLIEGSHDHKKIVELFDGFSKHDLFSADTEDLRRELRELLDLEERHQVRLFVRRDLLERSVSILVALPRDRFNADLRRQLQEMFMERFRGTAVEYHLSLGESDPAQIHFTVWVEWGTVPEVDLASLEADVVALMRSWGERVADVLVKWRGEDEGRRLAEAWCERFPEYYTSSVSTEVAAADILALDELASSGRPFVVGLRNVAQAGEELTRVVLYRSDGKRPLSELVPTLEHMGMQVVEEVPTRIEAPGSFFIHDFGVRGPDGGALDLDDVGDRVAAALTAVWDGEAESDRLNRLVVTAGLDHDQVAILRAYRTYWRRVAPVFTVAYVNDTLLAHPAIAANLVRLFELRFDPDADRDAYPALAGLVSEQLDAVPSRDEDRILRSFLRLIEATTRTSAFRQGRRSLAFKFRSADVPDAPRPHPMCEIFVVSADMEGVHLRGGPVARGGIRWSDRREDYRTEVLGLLKAQMTKNAVIVPTGAKGGFVLRYPPSEPAALADEVRRRYEVFIRGLLDLTDNRVEGRVVHPERVVVHDGDDPYLVVAADRGTATFSDLANEIAREYRFWLDDAFASGGSTGYDHKKLGITARGAWKSLERHFAEIGIDPHTDPFTVVGIGDMSGDVFGNGMLCSDRIKLVAAFDHRHIFLDPDPDPARSYAERRRLFDMAGSSWDDYDREVISEGGGVWPRSAKKIPISPQVRDVLGISEQVLSPPDLVKAILTAPVDLIWNGGIGTYVKARDETHEEVGDRGNDAVRVNGADLRARVVVEGGNLGFTQRGRIEYARRGGRINTDFIDNSGGVDCSDREVNLKILLGLAEERGLVDREERNRLVEEAADAVVERILYDNFQQVQMISQEELASPHRMEAYDDLMSTLEDQGIVDRDIDFLPTSEEIAERVRAGEGMTRPELAVLLADAKRSLEESLVDSDLPDDPYFLTDLHRYFPENVVERFGDLVEHHPLRRELVATIIANDVVNSEGVTFVDRLCRQTGADPSEVVRAYRVARDVAGAVRRWEVIESLFGRLDADIWNFLMGRVDRLVAVLTRWYLAHLNGAEMGAVVATHAPAFRKVESTLPEAGPPEWRKEREEEADRLRQAGVPDATARWHAYMPGLVHAPDIIEVAERFGRSVADVTRAFFLIGQAVRLDRLEEMVVSLPADSPWERWATQTMEDELLALRRALVEQVLAEAGERSATEAVDHYLAEHARAVARLVRFMRGLDAQAVEDLAPILVGIRQVRTLTG